MPLSPDGLCGTAGGRSGVPHQWADGIYNVFFKISMGEIDELRTSGVLINYTLQHFNKIYRKKINL